jgi:hypothetical protein
MCDWTVLSNIDRFGTLHGKKKAHRSKLSAPIVRDLEDHDISALAFPFSRTHQIVLVIDGRPQRFWQHPVKSDGGRAKVWSQESAPPRVKGETLKRHRVS